MELPVWAYPAAAIGGFLLARASRGSASDGTPPAAEEPIPLEFDPLAGGGGIGGQFGWPDDGNIGTWPGSDPWPVYPSTPDPLPPPGVINPGPDPIAGGGTVDPIAGGSGSVVDAPAAAAPSPAAPSSGWAAIQDAAIAAQAAAQRLVGGGSTFVPGQGPAGYDRGQALDYVAQLRDVLSSGTYLPNATGPGLTVLPGTPRYAAPASTLDAYRSLVAQLTSQWGFTQGEIASAATRLAGNIAAGVSLDPATSAAKALEDAVIGTDTSQRDAAIAANAAFYGYPAPTPAAPAPKAMTLAEYNAAARPGVIARAKAAGHDPSTADINATVRANYERYLAAQR